MEKTIKISEVNIEQITLSEARVMVLLHEGVVYTFFDEGTTRFVFKNQDNSKVLKMNKGAMIDYNQLEVEIYNQSSEIDQKQMAKPKLLTNGWIEQEFCMPIKFAGIKLNEEQKMFAFSCRKEVGFNTKGELVCFDLDEYKKY